MKTLSRLALAVCAVVVLASGCTGGSGGPRVAFITNNAEAFWNIAQAGAEKAAKEHGVTLMFIKPPSGDSAVQKEKIDQALSQGARAMAISVIDPDHQTRYLKNVASRTILLTQDNDAPDSGRLCYIGTDNYAAGRAAGALVRQAMPEGGTVVIFVGQTEPLNAQQRRQGVLDELSGKKNTPTDEGTRLGDKYVLGKTYTDQPEGGTKAKENAGLALKVYEKEKNVCMVGLWAYNPPAIYGAVKDKDKLGKVKIVGFDEDPKTLEGVKKGHIHGTIEQQPFEFGYQSVKLMAELINDDKSNLPEDGIRAVPHLAVTKDGKDVKTEDGKTTKGREVEGFHKELNKLLGKE